MSTEQSQLDWFRENAPAYLAGGLSQGERARLEHLAETSDPCRTELEDLMTADASLRHAAGVESIVAGLEDRVIAALDHHRRWTINPIVRRAALATAACVVLGTFGYLGSQRMENGRLWGWNGTPGNDLKQISDGLVLYANENHGTFASSDRSTRAAASDDSAVEAQIALDQAAARRAASDADAKNKTTSKMELTKNAAHSEEIESTVKALINNATELTREKKYDQANGVINQILVIDPANDYAVGAKPFIQDQANFLEKRNFREQASHAEEKKIPYDEVLRYPTDWPELSVRRDRAPTQKLDSTGKDNTIDADGDGIADTVLTIQNNDNSHLLNGKSQTPLTVGGSFGVRDSDRKSTSNYFDPTSSSTLALPPETLGQFRFTTDADGDSNQGLLKLPTNPAAPPVTYYAAAKIIGGKADDSGTANADKNSIVNDRKAKLKEATVSGGIVDQVKVPDGATLQFGGQTLAMGDAPTNAIVATTQSAAAEARKIIRTGTLEFEVDRFDSAAAVIGKIVGEQGGFVATTSSDKLANGKVRGSVVVRIPPERLDTFVLQLRGLGDLKSQRIGSQDIGKEYTDLDSELRADRAMEERLLDLIKNGKGQIKDLLAAEKELADWRGKIEKIVGQMKYYDNQVALSTLTITLMERDIATAAATVEQETINAGVEADDVEKARTAALSILADAKARIVSADLKKLDAGQMAATIVADIPPDGSGPVVDRIKQLGKVARMDATKSTTTDPNNPIAAATRVDRHDSRLTLSLYNLANVAPRQSSTINLAVMDVDSAYGTIIAKVLKAGGRTVSGGSTQTHADASRASAQVEVPADAAEAFLLDLRALGEVVSIVSTENTDTANVTSSKRGFAISVYPAAALPPRQSAVFRIETGDVEQTTADVQAKLLQAGGRVIDSATNTDPSGISTATLSIELPLEKSIDAIAAVRGSGKVLGASTSQDNAAPAGSLAKARVDVTFTTPGPITGDTGGLLANLRNGFSLSAKGLLYSAQLIVIGLCFVLPWLVVIGVGVKLWRRRKPVGGVDSVKSSI